MQVRGGSSPLIRIRKSGWKWIDLALRPRHSGVTTAEINPPSDRFNGSGTVHEPQSKGQRGLDLLRKAGSTQIGR